MAQWWERSPPTNVARVQIPASTPYVGWVCWRFFSGYSGFPLSWKTNISKFQFDQKSGRRRTTLWMCYFQIIICLFIYLFIYFLTSSSPFLVLVTSICGCRVCWDNQCDWPQYSQHLRNISGSGSVPIAIVGSLYVSGKLPTYPSPIVLVWNDIRLFAPSPIALPPVGG